MRFISAFALAALGAALTLTWPPSAQAQTYPAQQIKIVVPFSPGGAVDLTARIFAQQFQQSMKIPVIVENRPGAGGNLGVEAVAKAPPDGATILLNTNGQAISPATYKKLPWDPKDFAPVTQLLATNLLLVARPGLPVKNVQDLIALAKSKPGSLNYGSSGVGNPLHLTMELLKLRTGMDMQMVPFRGDGEIISALIGEQIDVAVVPISTGKQQVLAGAIRGLGVTANRHASGLDLLPIAEQGVPGFDAGGWQALFMPANTPRAAIERIYQESKKALAVPEVLKQIEGFAVDPVGSSPDVFSAFYATEVENFRQVVREARIPLQE